MYRQSYGRLSCNGRKGVVDSFFTRSAIILIFLYNSNSKIWKKYCFDRPQQREIIS